MADNGTNVIVKWAAGIIASLMVTGIVGLVMLYRDMGIMQSEVNDLRFDASDDTRQDKQLSKHWKIHNWSKDQINELRVEHTKPLVSWPDLD